MEPVLIDAYLRCRAQFGCSVDALLCSPEQRTAFLAYARQALGQVSEEELLRGLVNLRKRSKLPTDKGGGAGGRGGGSVSCAGAGACRGSIRHSFVALR